MNSLYLSLGAIGVSVAVTALFVLIIHICDLWMSARIKSEIQDELDNELENFNKRNKSEQ